MTNAPETFVTKPATGKEFTGMLYRMQVSPLDCTGCGNCVQVCPAKDQGPGHEASGHPGRRGEELGVRHDRCPKFKGDREQGHRQGQPVPEAPVRVLRRLRGLRRDPVCQAGYPAVRRPHDRLPTPRAAPPSTAVPLPPAPTPPTNEGHGPAWANSLFEDNAEFGFGMNLAITQRRDKLAETVEGADRR